LWFVRAFSRVNFQLCHTCWCLLGLLRVLLTGCRERAGIGGGRGKRWRGVSAAGRRKFKFALKHQEIH